MSVDFTGTYKLVHSENWDDFLKAVGVGAVQRMMMKKLSPPLEIKQTGESYSISVLTPIKTWGFQFKLGEEVKDQMIGGGKPSKSVTTREGNVLTQIQVCDDGTKVETVREINEDGELTVKLIIGDVTCKRLYKKE